MRGEHGILDFEEPIESALQDCSLYQGRDQVVNGIEHVDTPDLSSSL
jgi:hypothetical protein